jgi:hypothetical protein
MTMTDVLAAATVAYLPWARQGLAAPTAGGASPVTANGRLELRPTLALDRAGGGNQVLDLSAPVLRLMGPADAVGLDPDQVIRTEPSPHASAFEPNYFPSIEFDRPDLPWLFSPTVAGSDNRCQPWITLVVLPESAANIAAPDRAGLAILRCMAAELPHVEEAWAWAHVQVNAAQQAAAIADLLDEGPRALSRLVCARRLLPNVRYLALVVPTYELGRLAGLGTEITAEMLQQVGLAPAWRADLPDSPVELPVYYQWGFSTGAQGDFESLATRLSARPLPQEAGVLPVDLTQPGWGVTTTAGGTAPMHGALAFSTAQEDHWTQDLELTRQLGAVLNAPAQVADGLVGPPLYGQAYPRLSSLDPAVIGRPPPTWLQQLNLQARHRIAAGLGALAVRIDQDALMEAAWDQLADQERENQQARRQQLAEAVATKLAPSAGFTAPTLRRADAGGDGLVRANRLDRAGTAWARAIGAQANTWSTSAASRRSTTTVHALAGAAARAMGTRMLVGAAAAAAVAAPPAQEVLFTPRFSTPAGELLKDFFPSFLLPGLDALPADSVCVLSPNAAFIEAFMVGLNHEMGREMLWRGYPVDAGGTYFQRFWPQTAASADQMVDDIAPIAQWHDTAALGENGPKGTPSPDRIIVLIKGELLQRYPRAAVYARRADWSGSQRVFGRAVKMPVFQMDRSPDVTLLAIELSEAQLCGDPTPDGDPGWFIVLQELPGEPRFGLDALPSLGPVSWGGLPATWSDLGWRHAAADEAALEQLHYVPLSAWPAQVLPLMPGSTAQATWGRSSADLAAITRQAPMRMAIHGCQWFGRETP